MSDIQACVRYRIEGEEKIVEVWDDATKIEFLENVDCIRKITFYNAAIEHIEDSFRNIPGRRKTGAGRDYLTYTGDIAQFIVYNW
jgi:hypothetical protein